MIPCLMKVHSFATDVSIIDTGFPLASCEKDIVM